MALSLGLRTTYFSVPQRFIEPVSIAVAAYDPLVDIVAKSAAKPHFARVLRVRIEKDKRKMRREIIPPQAKVAANYTSPMIAKWKARREGYDEIQRLFESPFFHEGEEYQLFEELARRAR